VALAAVKLAHETTGTAQDDVDIPDATPGRESGGPRGAEPGAGRGRNRPRGEGMVRLYVAAGRRAGVRPQDLVGAITGESELRGRDVGAIDITDSFSLVEVPQAAADDVVRALRGTTIKGRKVQVRLDRDGQQPPRR
jgi:ATP-dependent RNA helicase DeaD